jgi:hypothetical protein
MKSPCLLLKWNFPGDFDVFLGKQLKIGLVLVGLVSKGGRICRNF